MKYTHGSPQDAVAWQQDVRSRLFAALKLRDLLKTSIPLSPRRMSVEQGNGYSLYEVEFNSTRTRRIQAIVTIPRRYASQPDGVFAGYVGARARYEGPQFPAVVCIHGHSGNRRTVYDDKPVYKGFADHLAAGNYVTIAVDVGQHEVYEPGRTLMGERLWDLMRCVDLLSIMPEVDKDRVGCGGLSLGGEMAMWLGAMDTRVRATVSCGFLTSMDQMEHNHCMCWKFDGLRELVDFADIYSLTAPPPLQCQNGLAEPPTQFPVSLAVQAMGEIKQIYADFGMPGYAGLAVHPGGHEVDLEAMGAFFKAHLGNSN